MPENSNYFGFRVQGLRLRVLGFEFSFHGRDLGSGDEGFEGFGFLGPFGR